MKARNGRPSPAIVVATIALVAALTGSAVALPGKGSIDKNDLAKGAVTKKALKKNAVTTKAIKDGGVTGADLAPGVIPPLQDNTIPDGSITGAKLADGTVGAADLADGSITGAKLADGTVGAADLTDPEAPRVPTFSNGGEGDCIWQSGSALIPGLAPVSFSKDPSGYVHLTGIAQRSNGSGGDGACDPTAPGESEDGIIYTLPAGYAPDNAEIQGVDGNNLVIIAGDEGLTSGGVTIPGGAVYQAGPNSPAMDGIVFRAAGPAARSSRSAAPDLGALQALID